MQQITGIKSNTLINFDNAFTLSIKLVEIIITIIIDASLLTVIISY